MHLKQMPELFCSSLIFAHFHGKLKKDTKNESIFKHVPERQIESMGIFLNSPIPSEAYSETAADTYFVDKSLLLTELFPAMGRKNKYFCITRPRRFGKSVMASMVGAFFGKTSDDDHLFDTLAISENENYSFHLHRHNVISIDCSQEPRNCADYGQYITRIQDGINQDLAETYTDIKIDITEAVWDILLKIFQKTRDKFIFVIDEWDAIFHKSFITRKDQKKYLGFLRNLLKDQVYVELAYMTGVLPIAKYSSGSELNMFLEYDMATKKKFSEYFGFLDSEVDRLHQIYKNTNANPEISRENLRIWYDGYYTAKGCRIYNPRSIVCALADNELTNYWTSPGPYDEIFYYIQNNIEAVRDDLILMAAGEGIPAEIQNYAAVSMKLDTKDEIYSAMVVYGLLTYHEGKVFIPNRELMIQFKKLLMTKASLGYVYSLARESEKIYK